MMQRIMVWLLLTALTLVLASCGGGGGTPTPPGGFTKLTAQVTDGADQPLSNLVVRVEGKATGVTTNASGSFELKSTDFPNGINAANELSFGRNGIIMGTYDLVPSASSTVVIKFGAQTASQLGGVSGMVYDVQTENPLPGVEISLFSEEGGVYTTVTGLDGYDLIGIPEGTWTLAASKEGYYSEMAVLQVVAEETTIQHIAMTPNGSVNPGQGLLVRGTLVDSETSAAIAGATVTMYCDTGYFLPCFDDIRNDLDGEGWIGDDEGNPMAPAGHGTSMAPYMYDPSYQETTTDENGHFQFEYEVTGYMVWLDFYADGYLNGSYSEDIYGESGEMVLNLTMDSYVETSAHGVVTDGQGSPIPGAYVELIYAGDMFYELPVAMPGTGIDWEAVNDSVSKDDFFAPAPPMTPGVDGGTWDDVNSTGTGQGEPGDPSVDNTLMMRFRWDNQHSNQHGVSDVQGFNGYFSTNADENGEFNFEGMPAGEYYLFVSAYHFLPIDDLVTIDEDSTKNAFTFNMEAVPVGVVEGIVTDQNGDPIADCLVNATQPNVDPFTYSDATGHYRIENVPAGTWFISGYKTGYLTESVEQQILADQTVIVNLALEVYTAPTTETIPFSGEVINGNDATKIADVDIVFTPVNNALGGYYQHVVSNTTGAYSCQLVPTEYNVLVQKDGYEDLYIRIWVDREWPSMDFWLWPINTGHGGPWGGVVMPMDDMLNGGTAAEPAFMPEIPKVQQN